jgi:hypothetical protein
LERKVLNTFLAILKNKKIKEEEHRVGIERKVP